MIELYEYLLDTKNLEVFPPEIWNDPYVVFHGTSSFHSHSIENEGFVTGRKAYNIEDGRELVRILALEEVRRFDNLASYTISNSILEYLEYENPRLSFAYLSSMGLLYSNGEGKGGQSLGKIRDAREIIYRLIAVNAAFNNEITPGVRRLFDLEQQVANENGVIYAIRLPQNLNGISIEYEKIHSNNLIPNENIIGKVIVPEGVNLNIELIKEKNRKKIASPSSFCRILFADENDDE